MALRQTPDSSILCTMSDESEGRERFATVLRAAMASKSQRDIAAAAGVDQTAVSGWLTGKAYPEVDRLIVLEDVLALPRCTLVAARLGLDVDELRGKALDTPRDAILGDPRLSAHAKSVLLWAYERIRES